MSDPVTPPEKRGASIPVQLGNVVVRCLAKDRNARFGSYAQLRQALEPFSSAAPTPATLGQRFLAASIDSIPATGVVLVLQLWRGRLMAGADPLPALGMIIIGLAYYGYFDGIRGATPGKVICGLRIVGPGRSVLGRPRA